MLVYQCICFVTRKWSPSFSNIATRYRCPKLKQVHSRKTPAIHPHPKELYSESSVLSTWLYTMHYHTDSTSCSPLKKLTFCNTFYIRLLGIKVLGIIVNLQRNKEIVCRYVFLHAFQKSYTVSWHKGVICRMCVFLLNKRYSAYYWYYCSSVVLLRFKKSIYQGLEYSYCFIWFKL